MREIAARYDLAAPKKLCHDVFHQKCSAKKIVNIYFCTIFSTFNSLEDKKRASEAYLAFLSQKVDRGSTKKYEIGTFEIFLALHFIIRTGCALHFLCHGLHSATISPTKLKQMSQYFVEFS